MSSWKNPSTFRTAAVIPAGGSGVRMGSSRPKQFMELAGKPVICHTLEIFERAGSIDTVHLVVPPGSEELCREEIIKKWGFKKVPRVVKGGETRQDSVFLGLKSLSGGFDRVAIHDGVRPFLSPDLLEKAVSECVEEVDGVVVAIPCKDTPKQAGESGFISSTLKRDDLFLAQTPQVFRFDILREAFERAEKDGYQGTDDSALVERIGGKVRIVPGDAVNIKITTPEDMIRAEEYVKNHPIQKAGT